MKKIKKRQEDMIAAGLIELGFIPLVDFIVSNNGGVETLTWLSTTSPRPTDAAIAAAIATAQTKLQTEQARQTAIQTDPTRIDMLQRLRSATPAQISTWVDNQVTGTTVQQVTAVKNILKAILLAIALDNRS